MLVKENYLLLSLLLLAASAGAFTRIPTTTTTTVMRKQSSGGLFMAEKSLVVVSPPGGVGEVTAVKAATMGSQVKWFVVSSKSSTNKNDKLAFPKSILAAIEEAGGKVELAGAEATSLIREESTRSAANSWCGTADAMVCCFDGVENTKQNEEDKVNPTIIWKSAVKVAAKEASKSITGPKLAILSVDDEENSVELGDDDDDEESGGLFGLLGGGSKEDEEEKSGGGGLFGLFGGDQVSIPSSLLLAMGRGTSKVRHGQLFGTPESSPSFSALEGGPLKQPKLCEEYRMRLVRVDPTLSVSGNSMMESTSRSSRHAVGEAAALMVLDKVAAVTDVCVTSLLGTDPFPTSLWQAEFDRVSEMLRKGQGAQLFSTDFETVPNVERFADWIATKWAPAVLRTFDIAAIRNGERPVYAARAGPGRVEIVFQELQDDFSSANVGKLVVQVTETGLVATRGPGDASLGFGEISRKPLQGEAVLVRRLADAASQAVDKGLAERKVLVVEPEPVVTRPPPKTVSSVRSVSTVETPTKAALESGPRQAGARRSARRARGTRKQTTNDGNEAPKSEGIDTSSEDSFQ